ncbi:MAG: hypothetical protein SGJ02_01110 [bacterium]|nr:hypothetical protein [bacterium]
MAVCIGYQPEVIRDNFVISLKVQLFLALILIIALSAKIWIRSEATQVGYLLASERQRAIDVDMKRRELELQKSFYLRPDNLAELAFSKLGLLPLNPAQAKKVIYVN